MQHFILIFERSNLIEQSSDLLFLLESLLRKLFDSNLMISHLLILLSVIGLCLSL